MNAALESLKRGLAAAGDRAGRSVYLMSVRDGIVAVLPLVLIGSFFYLLVEPPLVRQSWQQGYAAAMRDWLPRFVFVFKATTGMVSLYAAFAIAYHLARRRELDGLAAGLIAVATNLTAVAPLRGQIPDHSAPVWVLPLENVGPAGLFASILVAVFVVEVQRFLTARKWVVRLPDSVPEAVYRSFLSLLPAFASVASIWIVVHGFGLDLFAAVAQLSRPLQAVGNSLPGIWLVVLIDSVIWLFGIHAITILAVMKPIWLAMLTQNMEAAAAGQPLPNIAPREFYIWFVWMGGSGMSLALMLHLCLARARQLRSVAKVGFVPALFNLNEPIMFGVPVVMNPLLALPFVVAPLVCATTAWFAFHTNMVTRPHLDILWTLPAPIGAFGTTKDPGALVLMALNLGLAFLIYAPFVRAYDRRLLAQESRHGDAGGEPPQAPGTRPGAPNQRGSDAPTSVQLAAHASTPGS